MEIGKIDDTTLSETGTTVIQLIKDLKYNIQREHLTLVHRHEADLVRYVNITTFRHKKYHQRKVINNQDHTQDQDQDQTQDQDQNQTHDPLINKQTQPKTQFLNILKETILNIEYELHMEHLLIMNEQEFDIINYINDAHTKI